MQKVIPDSTGRKIRDVTVLGFGTLCLRMSRENVLCVTLGTRMQNRISEGGKLNAT